MNTFHNSPSTDVICFGESMVLLGADTAGDLADCAHFTRRLCGADSNVAIGLSRLGFGVRWISRVGDDAFGRFIIRALAEEGIGGAGIHVDPARRTGVMFKSRMDDGSDPQTLYYRAGSAASVLSPEDLDADVIKSARHLHVTGISAALGPSAWALCEHAMKAMRASGGTVSFDPNLRPALWPDRDTMVDRINALAGLSDWLLIGVNEAEQLAGTRDTDAIGDFYLDAGVRDVVIKRGRHGASLRSREDAIDLPADSVRKVIDTVGAGDGFAVGYISARLDGQTPREALVRGNAFGARAVQHSGDYEGLPHRAQLPLRPSSTDIG